MTDHREIFSKPGSDTGFSQLMPLNTCSGISDVLLLGAVESRNYESIRKLKTG